MRVEVVQLELVNKYSISLEETDGYAYGVESAGELFARQIGRSNIEMVGLICLDSTNKIINYSNISIGQIESVRVSIAQIFKVALLSNASQIMVAHNHPSGVLEITSADIEMTKNIGAAAKLFDIKLIDSLIVNRNGEVASIREKMRGMQ